MRSLVLFSLHLVALVNLTGALHAQVPNFGGLGDGIESGGGLDFGGFGENSQVSFEASFTVTKGTQSGVLSVKASVVEGWHIFSLTQGDNALPTEFEISKSDQYSSSDKFSSQPGFEIHTSKIGNQTYTYEHHKGEVVFSAPFKLADGVDPESLKIKVACSGQVCTDDDPLNPNDGQCVPIEQALEATFAGVRGGGQVGSKT